MARSEKIERVHVTRLLAAAMAADNSADRAYLDAQGVEQAIAKAVAQVVREKPANALARIAQLLAYIGRDLNAGIHRLALLTDQRSNLAWKDRRHLRRTTI